MKGVVIAVIIGIVIIAGAIIFLTSNQDNTQETSSNGQLIVSGDSENSDQIVTLDTETTNKEHTVEITSSGFSPNNLEINQGDTVIWVNKVSSSSWPASNNHPSHTLYSGFDSKKGLKTGESYSFTFTRLGSWSYHDHLSPSTSGTIIVN